MSDEKFQEFLQRELRDYNAPPAETPRDAMWQAIAEARAARRTSAAATPQGGTGGTGGAGGASLKGSSARRPFGAYAPWIGMAATLLVGIGIGRYVMSSPTSTTVAEVESSRAVPTGASTATAPEPGAETSPAPSGTAPMAVASVPTGRSAWTGTRNATVAPPRALPAATRAAPSTAFTLASRDHLQRAEALVSVVAATPADAAMDSLTGKWARQMLTNTRLLLDSPAGDDPVRRRLLEDLETVLVQLIQRSGAAAEERELLDRTLERTQLLTRLRSGAAGL